MGALPWRLLFVIKGSALNRGMNTGIENLAWQLAARGLAVDVLCGGTKPDHHDRPVPPGATYHFTGGDGLPGDHLACYRQLRAEQRFDAVIGWIRNLTPLALREPTGSQAPVFIANEGDLAAPHSPNVRRRARDLLAAIATPGRSVAEVWNRHRAGTELINRVCAISGTVQNHVVRTYGIPLARTTIIPRGIDLEFYQPEPAKDYTELNQPPCLLYTGNIIKSKGVADIVEALQYIEDPVEFVLCGNEKGYLSELMARISEIGRGHRLSWAGALAPEMLIQHLRKADIFLFCSQGTTEGLGKSLLEAMACGLPVVVSDIEACADVVTDRENALVVPVRDSKKIAEAIDAYLRDPALRARCGRNARRTIESRFTAASEIAAWLAVLERQIVEPPAT